MGTLKPQHRSEPIEVAVDMSAGQYIVAMLSIGEGYMISDCRRSMLASKPMARARFLNPECSA
jgi:hypothetical protein